MARLAWSSAADVWAMGIVMFALLGTPRYSNPAPSPSFKGVVIFALLGNALPLNPYAHPSPLTSHLSPSPQP